MAEAAADHHALTPPGSPDARLGNLQRIRRRYVVVVGSMACLLPVAGLVGLSVGRRGDHRPFPWLYALAMTGGLEALLLLTAWWSWRRQRRRLIVDPLLALDPTSVRQVGRDLRLGRILTPEQRPVARQLLTNQLRSQRLRWGMLALAVLWLALAVVSDDGWARWFRLSMGVAYLALVAWMWIISRRVLQRAAEQGIVAAEPAVTSRRSWRRH